MTLTKKTEAGIDSYTLDSGVEGPTLMFSGGVHGNEKAGPTALKRLIDLIEKNEVTLSNGRLIIVPVANPKAYEQNVRFVEYNLNRSMYPREQDEIVHYEDSLRNILCPYLEQTDYLLDLHSCTAPSEPFTILGGDYDDPVNVGFAKNMGVPHVLWGWSEAMQQSNDLPNPRHAFGMTEYAREHGARAVTVECGNHEHPHGPDFAFQAVLNTLKHLDMALMKAEGEDVFKGEQVLIQFKQAIFKTKEGTFSDEWTNMQPLSKGTLIGTFEDGQEFFMPEDGYIIMPNKNAVPNAEWFYWGV